MKKGWLILTLLLAGCSSAPASSPLPTTPTPASTPMSTSAAESQPEPSDESVSLNEHPADMSEYAGLDLQQNQFVEITTTEMLDMAEQQQSFIVYLGYARCPWCLAAVPVLNEVAEENETLIYYVDTHREGNYDASLQQDLFSLMSDWLQSDEAGEPVLYVPDVALIVEGEVRANHIATVDTHDPYVAPMTDQETAQLKAIYQQMIDQLKQHDAS